MRRTIKINNEVLKQMRKIFYPKGLPYVDWMGFRITDENKPSYHHIEKAEDLRKKKESDIATFDNGAYLGKKSHELLHKIEIINKELYNNWNELFLEINQLRQYPSEEIWNKVYDLQVISIKIIENNSKKLEL